MDLRQLRYFIAVAEEKNFSRAAKRLHVSQPPLSTHVKTLEQDLGVRLLDRSNRGVVLTPAGQVFYDEIRGVFRRLEHARLKAQNAGQGDVGTLSVGFVSIADYGILPPALKRFRERFPKIDVQLHELTTDAQVREIRAGRLQLGIGLAPIDEPDFIFEALLRERLLLAVPTTRRLFKANGAARLKAVSGESFIIPPREGGTGAVRSHRRRMPRQWIRAPHQPVRKADADRGRPRGKRMGVALVPSSVQNLKRAGVQYHSLHGSSASIEIGLLRPREDDGALADKFAAVLKEVARTSHSSMRTAK